MGSVLPADFAKLAGVGPTKCLRAAALTDARGEVLLFR